MLPTSYQQFIHLSRYARWDDNEGRRETWEETVQRYFEFFVPYLNEHHDAKLSNDQRTEWLNPEGELDVVGQLGKGIVNLQIMPSMRCLMTAGNALSRDHLAGYNCAYRPVNDIRAFDEILFILMCSTGVGFSVERQYVNQLPPVPERLDESSIQIVVRDSKRGWAEAYRELLGLLFAGRIPSWDTSKVREKGSRLFTMGGTASGPQPLIELFEFTIRLFQNAVGRKLSSVECHDLVCMIGECVVVGGVRRSALLSLSNLSDQRMRDAKSGEWYELTPWRRISNNSVAYTETPDVGQFMEEWLSLYHSKSGERGIFNREAARAQAMKSGRRQGYRGNGAEPAPIEFGTNPCSEIILRPKQLCNLSTIVARAEDDVDTLAEKIRLAAILGTWQACLTNFRYVTKAWQNNCEEERLLGVSMTNIMGNPILAARTNASLKRLPDVLEHLKEVAVNTNKEWAERLGINQATAVTCVKPEGTATQLVGVEGSGIHPAWSEYHIRRVREDKDGPVAQMMVQNGFPHEVDITNAQNLVFDFPLKASRNSVFRKDVTAIEQLEHWKIFQDHWCEHKPSITVYAREKEWPAVGGWVYENFDSMSGVSFLPYSDHIYKQAPYEEITKQQYDTQMDSMPEEFDMASELGQYENEDHTTGSRELACSAGHCEI
jgi:ribonucleoside-diphosphate reductase alpha chain